MKCNEGSKSFVDVDGIRHSFDNSIHVSSSDGPRKETTVSFLASASRGDANPQSKDDIEQSFLHATGHSEKNDRDVGPSGSSESIPQMGKTCLSPFSSFLNRTPQAITPRAISPIAQTSTATEAGQFTSSSNFVTSLDLLALEQRMQTMVSELTTSISSRLIEQFAMPVSQAPGTSTGTETSVTNMESSLMVSPASTTGGRITPPAGHSRKGRRQTRVREKSTARINPGDQHSASKRPRPRMQLTGSMYRKHPIFKFFVTAPIDSANNPHKWRCRVCHIELSLKTKGSLEFLSHYRTDAHLVREHRIRMETPGMPLYGKNELELTGADLAAAREKAELEIPNAPILGECYLLAGQRKLSVPTDELDPSTTICCQIRLLLTGLKYGGDLDTLTSLWGNLGLEVRGPIKVPQYSWDKDRVFVSIFLSFWLSF